jgi:hypothetical protein
MNLLKLEKSLYRAGHPWRNYRPLTELEKVNRRSFREADSLKADMCVNKKVERVSSLGRQANGSKLNTRFL